MITQGRPKGRPPFSPSTDTRGKPMSALPKAVSVLAAGMVLLSFIPGTSPAGTTGKVAGKIVDAQTNEALVGVNVVVVGTTLGASSDIDGQYFILNIPPGTYTIKASSVGYTATDVDGVKVNVDQTTRIDFKLQSTEVQMSDVVVTATRPIVQKDLTSTVSSVTGEQLGKLPLEDVASVVNLQAGVVDGHFRGGRSNEVKYLIDGVAVNDVFSGNFSMEAEVNSIQEIQVLSGTFNAEYGEALSGVVNQVTKVAGESYHGEVSGYTGDYTSNRTGLFPNINHISPADLNNFQGNLSGPVPGTGGFMKMFLSGRYIYDAGYIYGKRVFNPTDSSNFSANDPSQWYIGATGDGKYVPMNNSTRYTLQGKFSFGVGTARGIVLNTMYQQNNYRVYDHQFQLNPDGDYQYHQKGFLGSLSYTHVFSDASFLDVLGSLFISDYKQYVYPDPLYPGDPVDPRYVNPERLRDAGANAFLTGGTQNWHFSHNTNTWTGKLDFTSQLTTVHQIKTGIETQFHRLLYRDYQIHVDATTNFIPAMPPDTAFDFNFYLNHPYQLAAYIQDKIELDYLVVNIGFRFDYFEPDGSTLINPDNIAVLDTLSHPYPANLFRKASAKYQVSPRIGLSYPISDKGAVHISYGHFFQIPAFDYLYKNPNFRIPLSGDFPEFIGNTIGNADLQPQRTTMYEIGLQEELAPMIGVTVTGYYKDIRNLLGLQIHIKNNFKKFGEYVNLDYGSVKGFTVSFEKRLSNGFGANIDYTFQVAKGDASDPNDAFNKAQATPPIEPNKQLVPLSWDRRHSLNVTATIGDPNSYIASIIGRLGSGLPYTPALQNQRTGLENSANKPTFYNVDLYVTKYFDLNPYQVSVFVKVYNLFDTANELDVFSDTGRAGYTLELTRPQQAPRGVNTLAQYFTRPDFYSAPRQVIIGAALTF
jgi:outer membrane receptor protein involved in Fe transport